jgi:hypothetical protein
MEISSVVGMIGKITVLLDNCSSGSCDTQEAIREEATTPAAPAPMDFSIKVLLFIYRLVRRTKIKNLAEKSLFVYFLQKMDFY